MLCLQRKKLLTWKISQYLFSRVFKESSKSGNEIEQRIDRGVANLLSECVPRVHEPIHSHVFLYFDKNSTHSHIPNPKLHLVSFAFTFNREAKKIYLNHHVDFLTLLTPKFRTLRTIVWKSHGRAFVNDFFLLPPRESSVLTPRLIFTDCGLK